LYKQGVVAATFTLTCNATSCALLRASTQQSTGRTSVVGHSQQPNLTQ